MKKNTPIDSNNLYSQRSVTDLKEAPNNPVNPGGVLHTKPKYENKPVITWTDENGNSILCVIESVGYSNKLKGE